MQFSDEKAGVRQPFARVHRLGDPQIDDLDGRRTGVRLREHEVVGGDVAMNDPFFVQRSESAKHLLPEAQNKGNIEGFAAPHPLDEGHAIDELLNHVVGAIRQRREVEQGSEVGVFDGCSDFRLAQKALLLGVVRKHLRLQNFDGPEVVEVNVADLVKLSHASNRKHLHHLVFPVDGVSDGKAILFTGHFSSLRVWVPQYKTSGRFQRITRATCPAKLLKTEASTPEPGRPVVK